MIMKNSKWQQVVFLFSQFSRSFVVFVLHLLNLFNKHIAIVQRNSDGLQT